MLDEYIWGDVRRISPEAPVPVVEFSHRTFAPGGAANVAANVGSLRGQALLGGVVGRDYQAIRLRDVMRQRKISPDGLIEDNGRPTTTKTRIVAQSQQLVRVDSERRLPLRADFEDALLGWVAKALDFTDACVLSDYDKGVVSPRIAEHVIHVAQDRGIPVVVDPKGTDYSKYRRATVVTPNVREAGRALNQDLERDADLTEVGRRLLDMLDGSALLVTQGSQGMSLFVNGTQPVHISAAARHVFDVTGAGDTVIATLALALAAGATLEYAADIANRAAGIVVGKSGTAAVTIEELISDQVVGRGAYAASDAK